MKVGLGYFKTIPHLRFKETLLQVLSLQMNQVINSLINFIANFMIQNIITQPFPGGINTIFLDNVINFDYRIGFIEIENSVSTTSANQNTF